MNSLVFLLCNFRNDILITTYPLWREPGNKTLVVTLIVHPAHVSTQELTSTCAHIILPVLLFSV